MQLSVGLSKLYNKQFCDIRNSQGRDKAEVDNTYRDLD